MENEGNEGTALADKIWSEYYKMENSKRYFGLLAHQYYLKNIIVRFSLTLVTSTAVAGLKFWSKIPVVWEIVSAIAVFAMILNTVFNFQKSMCDSEILICKFASFSTRYKRLQSDVERGGNLEYVEQEYNVLIEKEELVSIPAKFSKYKEKLQKKSENEVRINEGIEIGGAENEEV